MATAEHQAVVERLTRDEILDEMDRLAQARLGISGEEFFVRWQAGGLDEFDPTVARIAVLARLLTYR